MKVIGFNGSARKDGNTAILIRYVFEGLEKEGIETELYQLSGKKIHGCRACNKCFENKDKKCSFEDDVLNECIEKILGAEGVVLGSPTYFADLTTEMKALIDRAGIVARANDSLYRRKIGAAVVAARRGGSIHALDSLNHFFLVREMIIPGSTYWNLGFGMGKGEVEKDEEGIQTMKTLGENMAWLMKKIHG